MIVSYGDAATEDIFEGRRTGRTRRFHRQLQEAAKESLDMLHAAVLLADLRSPPGNRLEALVGNLRGFHSIRVTGQWRITFLWTARGAERVRLVDYH